MRKYLKWIFLGLWFICVVAFVVGQFLAPPEYHLLPGNFWGGLFGFTSVFGIIFFCLAIVFFIVDSVKNRQKKKTQLLKPKYNLSFGRIISRLFLTGVIGIIFGIAMFPFMTVAEDGLLMKQQISLGGQNMTKMVALWGIFTLIVLLFTLWKKRFRMVSVFLIICWLISIVFQLMLGMYDANEYRCKRMSPYSLPGEFNRSLDLIVQRMGIDTNKSQGTILQSAFNYRNCLDIQYSKSDSDVIEAYFEYPSQNNLNSLQDLKIVVNPSYKNFDDLTLATLLIHEITHAGEYINEVESKNTLTCYEQEAKAFVMQHSFLLSLNDEEQRSIFARLRENSDKNPTFQIITLTSQRARESTKACVELQKRNNLTNEQMYKCSWEGLESKILQDIKEDSYYQKQCSDNQ